VAAAVESVIHQDYENIEYIIIDGKSSDGTFETIRKYAEDVDILISEADDGIYDAMNKGLTLATGEVIGFIHGDDFLADPDVIGAVATKFQKEPDLEVVYGDKYYIPKKGNKIVRKWTPGEFDRKRFENGWVPPHLSTYIKKSCYEKWGNFKTSLDISADYELMLRFIYFNRAHTSYLPRLLVIMRMGGASTGSIKNVIRGNYQIYKSWKLNDSYISPWKVAKEPFKKIWQYLRLKNNGEDISHSYNKKK
jgi:glycosyltransferase